MLFDWFRRRKPAAAQRPPLRAPAAPAVQRRTAPSAPEPAAPAPLPEVVAEGNTQADWSAWEDSMTALDSQMQGLVPSARIYVRETRPSQMDEIDAFGGVKRNRDL
jgi:hypothetical protein